MERDARTYAIIGAAMEVHRELGPGFLEPVYQEALARELSRRNISYQREQELPIYYKGEPLSTCYKADFICYDTIVVELKALGGLGGVEESQVINYLKATGKTVGLLINFGTESLQFQRFANEKGNRAKPIRNTDDSPR